MSNIKKRLKKLTLPEKIKLARRQAGLTQQQMSKALKVSDKAISSYEVGRAQPGIEMIKAISKITYKPVAYFMSDDNAEEIELQAKLAIIERELAEVKELLLKRPALGED